MEYFAKIVLAMMMQPLMLLLDAVNSKSCYLLMTMDVDSDLKKRYDEREREDW